ncbi:MAG TPA: ATP-grasp domain-containing protein, partial [Chitinophagales bacterium]|nr:ATP-grasp domain-containing protein [Chitinophagales bacterium]
MSSVAPFKVCVLQPDYSTSDVDYQYYDPPRNLQPLLPNAIVDHVFLNKLTTYKQLRELKKKGYDIYVNLCEGYLDWSIPSIDVIYCMELLGLPFTGPSSLLYDPTKELMKYVAFTCGVKTPAFVLLQNLDEIDSIASQLQFPLFVKPSKAGDSLGVDEKSLVHDVTALKKKAESIIEEYGPLLVEEYIAGREFTALVIASPDENGAARVLQPIEYIFPEGFAFKTYALKTSELHP